MRVQIRKFCDQVSAPEMLPDLLPNFRVLNESISRLIVIKSVCRGLTFTSRLFYVSTFYWLTSLKEEASKVFYDPAIRIPGTQYRFL